MNCRYSRFRATHALQTQTTDLQASLNIFDLLIVVEDQMNDSLKLEEISNMIVICSCQKLVKSLPDNLQTTLLD